MIDRILHINHKMLLVSISQTIEEREELIAFARQTHLFSLTCKKTGVHITLEESLDEIHQAVVVSLREPAQLVASELELLKQQCREVLQRSKMRPPGRILCENKGIISVRKYRRMKSLAITLIRKIEQRVKFPRTLVLDWRLVSDSNAYDGEWDPVEPIIWVNGALFAIKEKSAYIYGPTEWCGYRPLIEKSEEDLITHVVSELNKGRD